LKESVRQGLVQAPRVGFEPTTNRLTAGCSTVELSGINRGRASHPLRGRATPRRQSFIEDGGPFRKGRLPDLLGIEPARAPAAATPVRTRAPLLSPYPGLLAVAARPAAPCRPVPARAWPHAPGRRLFAEGPMRFATLQSPTGPRAALLRGEHYVDLQAAGPALPASLRQLLEQGPAALQAADPAARPRVAAAERAPAPRPLRTH